jgi:hypothetical protein
MSIAITSAIAKAIASIAIPIIGRCIGIGFSHSNGHQGRESNLK